MGFSPSTNWKRGLRRASLVGLAALIVAGVLIYRDQMSPARAWRRAIRDPDPKTREVLWTRLQRDKEIRGLDREETAREVLALLQDPDAGTRLQAVTTLSLIESDPLEAIPRLTDRLADPDVEVRARAASALGDVFKRKGPGRDEAIEAISTALKDRTALVRAAAVSSLGQVIYESGESADPLRSGRADDPALTLVENRLKDDDADVRAEAAYVLACNNRGGQAVPMLVDYLHAQPPAEPPTHAADRAFLALMVLAVHDDPAADYLGSAMSEAREGYPDRPKDALVWVARQSGDARARVRRVAGGLLNPENPKLRRQAGLLLHEIGSDQAAFPILVETLKDDSVELRIRAVEALADIGGTDPAVVPALETATNDPNPEVRERAASAIEQIEWAEILSELSELNP